MRPEIKDEIEIRKLNESDLPFIFSTWLRGLYFGNGWFREIPESIYFPTYHRVIEEIIKRPDTHVQIACLKSDPDVIVGYTVYRTKEETSESTLHWAYTKEAFRNLGIMKALTPENVTSVSHQTRVGLSIARNKWPFNPFWHSQGG